MKDGTGNLRRRALLLLTLVVVATIVVGVVVAWRWLWTPTGPGADEELAYWQLVVADGQLLVGLVALVLAGLFGLYAIDQVALARRGIELAQRGIDADRDARQEALAAETAQILLALLLELSNNYENALRLEGRLVTTRRGRKLPTPSFTFTTFQALATGPLWRLKQLGDVWPALSDAYLKMQHLSRRLDALPWWSPLAFGGLLAEALPRGVRLPALLLGSSGGLAYASWLNLGANIRGDATRARLAIEAAMDQLVPLLPRPTSWREGLEQGIAPGWRMLPADGAPAPWWALQRRGDYRAVWATLGLLWALYQMAKRFARRSISSR